MEGPAHGGPGTWGPVTPIRLEVVETDWGMQLCETRQSGGLSDDLRT
jgi:hypothetical protein